MQSAETVLDVLRERGRRGLPLDELYRQLFNPQLYLLAYGRIYSNKGAMTPGPVTARGGRASLRSAQHTRVDLRRRTLVRIGQSQPVVPAGRAVVIDRLPSPEPTGSYEFISHRIALDRVSVALLTGRRYTRYVTSPRAAPWMTDGLILFRETARDFFRRVSVPHHERWAAQQGLTGSSGTRPGPLVCSAPGFPPSTGAAAGPFAHEAIALEEQARAGDTAFGNAIHSSIVTWYVLRYATEAQKQRWLPRMASGELGYSVRQGGNLCRKPMKGERCWQRR
jgi:Acyl-CoA dehydrogenase, N-terminal domain